MKRRNFITLLGGAAVAWPLAAKAQQGEPVRRVGVLVNLPDDPIGQARVAAFVQGLQAAGWVEGRNVRIDIRWADSAASTTKRATINRARGPALIARNP
jgi:putative tryptophan/tyrosine transport system substrate-binding protein